MGATLVPGVPIGTIPIHQFHFIPGWEGDVEHLDEHLPVGEKLDLCILKL